ncbi:hypothetical protein AB0J37_27655 [Microbispora rosea]|uniref:hypothetical protein n=1 Tax=Microbispora rosea TaxID=58117 RepID=UPI0034305B22
MLDLLLAHGGATATTLGERLPVTRQAVAKHLGVLDRGRPGAHEADGARAPL